ncbi:glutathione S-transferase family protein [Mangrovicoccus sp. HB161399]|uniref:glutathione S-transferase family protein n=1 Tax=Mangrovicoccus sp. HB161399 TaxID=2720392 RepID=UPI001C132936|nr:glutathione S-transferase [Mangrovicoccus sp. HB161399]
MARMTLFHAPGSCSLGIHLLLEETGAPYAMVPVDLARGEQRGAAFLSVNPKGKVPALKLPDGSVLTEFPVIALWLARQHPEAALLPAEPDREIRVLELTEHIVSGLHMRGSVFAMRPDRFAADPAMQEVLRAHGREVLSAGQARLEEQLGGQPFLFGSFSIADAAAFYLLSWSGRTGVALTPALERYMDGLRARASARTVLAWPARPAEAG